MKVVVVGGTRFVGPAAVGSLLAAGHEVAIAHSGAHEHPAAAAVEHLHGDRDALLSPAGPIDSWRPDVVVDTFPGGATAIKGEQLAACAARTGARVVAISSVDVYGHGVDSGMGDGSGSLEMAVDPIPLGEDARRRVEPYPGAAPGHDNVAMEDALGSAGCPATLLRPGAIYGPHPSAREWTLVRKVALGDRDLPLPDGGVQVFHRVALDRVARAIAAATGRSTDRPWACNVVDPYDRDYSGLARRVGAILDWEWEPRRVPFSEDIHPWQVSHPMLASDRRLRDDLGIAPDQPDPDDALRETVEWLWDPRGDPRERGEVAGVRSASDIEGTLAELGTAERAEGSKRYLKSSLRHLGASVPQLRAEAKAAAAEIRSRRDLRELAEELWAEPVFDRRACAAYLLDYRVDLLGPGDLPMIKRFVGNSGTWALVDPLSADLLGHLLLAHRGAAARLDPWTRDRDFWVRRAALLSQLRPLKAGGDFERFGGWADAMLDEREFFIRKAIGWVLREVAKKRPALVYEWLLPRTDRASGVTIREAVKYLEPDQREAILARGGRGSSKRAIS